MESFQKLLALSMLLPQVPPVLQKRIIKIMIKDCDIGLSAEESKEFEEMYESYKELIITGGIIKILEHIIKKLQSGRIDEAIQIVSDLHVNLQMNIRCLAQKEGSQKIKEYLNKLEKNEKRN